MKLETLDSRMILPSTFVEDGEIPVMERLAWACAAFDIFVKGVDARRLVLSAPYSLESIQALTDDELQQYYKEFGLATYYPDISRNARNLMLYDEQRMFRRLGTKAAIEAMIQYIFGDNPISLEIIDNLAFDSDGQLIDESLLNLYDANITAQIASLDRFQLARIFENITKFNRDTQELRYITIRYESEQTMHLSCIENDIACIFYDSQVLCEWYHIPSVVVGGLAYSEHEDIISENESDMLVAQGQYNYRNGYLITTPLSGGLVDID